MTATVEELAPRTEDEVRAHLAAGKLVEGLQHMSPEYLKGIRRILTVSADTELVTAPAYLRAAAHAPALNNFGSAVSIIQDELAHAHIGYRLLGDLGVDMPALIYEREPRGLQVPVRVRRAAGLLVRARARQRALRPGRVRAALRRAPALDLRAVEARAGQGRQGGDVPPAPRPHVGQEARRRPGREGASCRRRWTGCSSSRSSGSGCRTRARSTASSSSTASRAAPTTSCARTGWATSSRSWTRSGSTCRRTSTRRPSATSSTARSRSAFDAEEKRWGGPRSAGTRSWCAGRAAGR